jgi:hypothetical protein
MPEDEVFEGLSPAECTEYNRKSERLHLLIPHELTK